MSKLDMTPGARRAVAVLLVLVLVLFAANLEFTVREIAAARSAAASVTQLCQSGNEARAQQIALWRFIIGISPPPRHETAAARRQRLVMLGRFLAHLRAVFAPRNCGG